MASATSYDPRFYDAIRDGCQRSAAAALPWIYSAIGPVASVVDVGCGEGWWAHEFTKYGAERVLGIDGDYVEGGAPIERISHDLSQPLISGGVSVERFDLAVSLEVAEHLPPGRAASFVADLCALAPTVLFSAAMPGQGGTGHVNCQPPGYWADLFGAHGYAGSGGLRWDMWDDLDIEPWYRSNLLLFTKYPTRVAPAYFDAHPSNQPLHVIATDLWITR